MQRIWSPESIIYSMMLEYFFLPMSILKSITKFQTKCFPCISRLFYNSERGTWVIFWINAQVFSHNGMYGLSSSNYLPHGHIPEQAFA